ncbi:MAG: hypothetical protein C0478_03525, partial [Planctomyces sp.]|nr:hypothetical protein [Planctomyces sp.]
MFHAFPSRTKPTRPFFRRTAAVVLAACATFFVTGCGNDRPALPVYSVEGLKRDLTSISQTGDGGSALEGIKYSVDKLVTEKFPGADELKKLQLQLEKAPTPDRRKALAADMLKVI